MLVRISIVTPVTIYFVTTVTQLPAPTSANATKISTIPNTSTSARRRFPPPLAQFTSVLDCPFPQLLPQRRGDSLCSRTQCSGWNANHCERVVLIKNNTNEKGHSHHICILLPPPSAIRTTTSGITTEQISRERCFQSRVSGTARTWVVPGVMWNIARPCFLLDPIYTALRP